MTYLTMKGFNKTTPPIDYLCFTANTAGSTVQLTKNGSPTSVSLETSTDRNTWNTYTMGSTITLSNIGDKVYRRSTSETNTKFSTNSVNFYQFVMSGSISASGDINYLINKNSTTILPDECFDSLFRECTSLTTPPKLPATTIGTHTYFSAFFGCTSLSVAPELPATTLGTYCYYSMFSGCTGLTTLPKLPATSLPSYCYTYMFSRCSNIKLSTTQTGEYQTEYRIPITGTGTGVGNARDYMFNNTGGTFTGTPTINTTYYTSNTLVG